MVAFNTAFVTIASLASLAAAVPGEDFQDLENRDWEEGIAKRSKPAPKVGINLGTTNTFVPKYQADRTQLISPPKKGKFTKRSKPSPKVGINLGTTNSHVGIYRDDRSQIIPNTKEKKRHWC